MLLLLSGIIFTISEIISYNIGLVTLMILQFPVYHLRSNIDFTRGMFSLYLVLFPIIFPHSLAGL